ncbi:MAG: hypothetical protein JXR68_08920 [Bacteroidales bacterium]|nr:hypothetical protein [Bacteroidales bacterium]
MLPLIWNLSFLITLFLYLPTLSYNSPEKTDYETIDYEKTDYEKIGSDFVAKYNERKGLKKSGFHTKLELKQSFDTILNDFQASCYGIKLNSDEKYQEVIDSIAVNREKLKTFYENSSDKSIVLDSVRNYFIESFLNHIVPHWYGTEWTMNGTTQIPQQGTVGCSYFVANTLFSMGFDFNRAGVAQSSSRNIARTFQLSEDVVLLKSYTITLL